MKRLFRKIFQSSRKEIKEPDPGFVYNYPPLSPSLTLVQTRELATIGFLARKMGQFLELDPNHVNSLFYHVMTSSSGQEAQPYVELAESLFTWIKNKENVWQKVQFLDVSDNVKSALLQVYEDYQFEIAKGLHISTQNSEKNNNYQVYRDVIYAASQKKFLLISDEEINHYLQGNILYEQKVKTQDDVPASREGSKKALMEIGYDSTTIMSKCLVISEAVTNILKHADKGKMLLVEDDGEIRVIVEDNGPGFSLPDLPNAVLMSGYSTKKSLGQGFNLMMRMAEQIVLCTSSKGSTLILLFANEKSDGHDN